MSKPGADPSSGISSVDVLIPTERHPACRQREARSGSCTERENLAGDGRNLRVDVRWAASDVDRTRMFAKELVGLQPDVILGSTTAVVAALQRETRTIPIVFAGVGDPIGTGLVAILSRPGGNITGFTYVEAEMAGKWL